MPLKVLFVFLMFQGESFSKITCINVTEKGSGSSFSVEELKTLGELDTQSIKDCIIILGKEELTHDQSKTIWAALLKIFGTAEDIPEESLQHLGWITNGIDPEDFYNLTLTEIDTVSSFGQCSRLSGEQLKALQSAIFEQWSSKDVEDLSSFDLIALRQILCAFNESDILKIHPDAYKDAAPDLATLQNCSNEVLEALATLASSSLAFGDPQFWTSLQVATIGCIVGGLQSMKVIPIEAMEGFTKDTISCLPPYKLKEFSDNHLKNLSPSAAGGLTGLQLGALYQSQKYAVESAVKGLPINDKSSGGNLKSSMIGVMFYVNWRILCKLFNSFY